MANNGDKRGFGSMDDDQHPISLPRAARAYPPRSAVSPRSTTLLPRRDGRVARATAATISSKPAVVTVASRVASAAAPATSPLTVSAPPKLAGRAGGNNLRRPPRVAGAACPPYAGFDPKTGAYLEDRHGEATGN